MGLQWLDRQARALGADAFAELPPEQREAVVGRAAAARHGTTVRNFFDASRRDVFGLYYSDPRTWPALAYAGPPQPVGFPNHTRPPEPAA